MQVSAHQVKPQAHERRCPHIATTGAICVYCPGGPDSDFEYSTQSYTGYEPTSMRAIRARYNPYVQARCRVDQLRRLGHSVDKVGGMRCCRCPAVHCPIGAAVNMVLMGGGWKALHEQARCRSRH